MENAKIFYGYMVDTSKSLIYKKVMTSNRVLKFMLSWLSNLVIFLNDFKLCVFYKWQYD